MSKSQSENSPKFPQARSLLLPLVQTQLIIHKTVGNKQNTNMHKRFFFTIFSLLSFLVFSQESNERVLLIVDSIPIFDMELRNDKVVEEDIDTNFTIRDKSKLIKYKEYNLDAITYVFTKKYKKRPDSIKKIPSKYKLEERDGSWYLKFSYKKYTGNYINYYLNGNIYDEGKYKNGKLDGIRKLYLANGKLKKEFNYSLGKLHGEEKTYFENGKVSAYIENRNGKLDGKWELYYPNDKIKHRSHFKNGLIDGESISYYSSGKINQILHYKNGKGILNKTKDKAEIHYRKGLKYYREFNFKNAIKEYNKAIKTDTTNVNLYFARGTALLNNRKYDEAIEDLNRTIELEPYYMEAYANRAFVLIRKYEEQNDLVITKSNNMTITTDGEVKISKSTLMNICRDLNSAIALGDKNVTVVQYKKRYCE